MKTFEITRKIIEEWVGEVKAETYEEAIRLAGELDHSRDLNCVSSSSDEEVIEIEE